MTPLWQFLALLAVHWLADFVLQTHWQATNKSKCMDALLAHVGVYTLMLTGASALIFGLSVGLAAFLVINSILHFTTDYVTSRASSRLYAKQDWHNFFVIIGFDQLIHQATLAITMVVFLQ